MSDRFFACLMVLVTGAGLVFAVTSVAYIALPGQSTYAALNASAGVVVGLITVLLGVLMVAMARDVWNDR